MKKQELIVTRASKYIAVISSVIAAVEDVWDESFEMLSVDVPWWLGDPWDVLSKIDRLSGGSLKVSIGVPERGLIRDEYIDDIDVNVEVFGDPEMRFEDGRSLRDLYIKTSLAPVSLDSTMIRSLALKTSRDGIEFMIMYLKTGSVAIFEGEHFRVSLPAVWFSKVIYHTHPHGSCGLSVADIKSTLEFLVNGGLAGAAATDSCVSYMLRMGFVDENDFIKIKRMKRPLILGTSIPKLKSLELGFLSY